MKDTEKIVESMNKLLDMLPELNENEKKNVEDIKKLLERAKENAKDEEKTGDIER